MGDDGRVLVIAQITDTHFGGSPAAAGRVRAVLDHLLAMDPRPDLLLVTGDIADHGLPEEYAEARDVLGRWPGPIGLLPGNHDVRGPFVDGLADLLAPARAALENHGRIDHAVEVGGHRFLLLDSLVDAIGDDRQDHGVLTDGTLAWLTDELRDTRPSYLALHHPTVELGLELMDPIRLREPERLAAVIEAHEHVRAVLVGHAHSMAVADFAGRRMLIGGGVVSAVQLDREPGRRIWLGAPPTFALHLIHDDGRLVTFWRSLPG